MQTAMVIQWVLTHALIPNTIKELDEQHLSCFHLEIGEVRNHKKIGEEGGANFNNEHFVCTILMSYYI